MPRPKSTYLQHKHLFVDVNVINESELLTDIGFNVNTKIIIKCENNHTYNLSVTKVKSLNKIPTECPHCLIKDKHEQCGIEHDTISKWANKFNFSVVNVQKYYNRFKDKVIVKCDNHDYTKEIKSLSYLEKNINKISLECPHCVGKYTPITLDKIAEKIEIKSDIKNIELKEVISYDTLPPNLKNKLLSQNKWRLIQYTNTKNKCSYQCGHCGFIKQCLPYNLFLSGGMGCLGCRKNTDSIRVCEKIRNICIDCNFYPKNKLEYTDITTPIEFVCNNCGDVCKKSWASITGNYYKITCDKCYTSTKRKSQSEFYDFIKSIEPEAVQNDKNTIEPYELDIVCHSKKVAFEFCGVIWHSSKFKNDRSYHKKKYDMCNEVGYRLITIFDDEWKNKTDICKSRITSILGKSGDKVYARKCEIVEVDSYSARDFFNANHIQGSPSKSGLCYGLKYNGNIVCMMSFAIRHGKIKSGDCQWELQRYAAVKGCNVTGGAGKLLNNFIKIYKDISIVTFSDNRWGNSEFYKKIGFLEDKILDVDYTYCGVDTRWCRKHKFGFDKKKLVKKCISLGIPYTNDDTETTLSEKLGLYRIYDCGHIRYIRK